MKQKLLLRNKLYVYYSVWEVLKNEDIHNVDVAVKRLVIAG